ncbi:squalene/phytoene synthase family protein [Pelagibacteraceae bacterium]|jgi:phytoene synthase|nr:squalene/phytoene synthase family protein [Pelagibacteraceae bacterium]
MNDNLIEKHAKTFYWASFFLSREIFKKCSALYNFCRTLDDIADDISQLEEKKNNFAEFKRDFLKKNFNNSIIKEMWSIVHSENISKKVVIDLFDGVETDLEEKVRIKSKKDLLVYSYRVAGTVGLMMSKILKVKDKEALKGAIDLGIAMQLTNIARDVIEDKERDRKYIESDFSYIQETIKESEIFYQKSFNSISSIPLRSRFSVIVARRVYKKIGHFILKQKNIENYNKAGKIYVPIFEKITETFLSIFDFIKLLFVKEINYDNHINHNILEEKINLNERI